MMKPFYDDGKGIVIYCGDNREIANQLGRFDLLLTDPPYGIFGNDSVSRHDAANGWAQYGVSDWDKEPACNEFIGVCRSKCGKSIIWGGNYFSLPPSMGWLVWNKGQRNFSLADGEL